MKPRAHLIANLKSGQGKGALLKAEAGNIANELGYELVHYDIKGPADFEKQSALAVERALQDGGLVIAAGGDGTIRGVAQAAHGKNVRFGAIPCGTFNFFARSHHIPEDPLEAFRLALTGTAQPVRLGKINGHVFLINASLGLYSKAIRERESRTRRFGRHRVVVIISTALSLLSRHLLLQVDLVSGGTIKTVQTPMIFIGNNALQLRDLAMDVARCMKQDLLAVVLMKPVTRFGTLHILFHGLFKILEKEERLESFCVDELVIHTNKKRNRIALDGEVLDIPSPLRVQALPEGLNLVRPPKTGEA